MSHFPANERHCEVDGPDMSNERSVPILPSVKRRAIVAVIAGLFGGSLAYGKHLVIPWHAADFAVVRFGADAILHGANPYALVGPGRVFNWLWNLYYPATAMVVAIPFTMLPQLAAVIVFVAMSSALLAYAVTADGWYRLPLFFCVPFVTAAGAGQWSILFTAGLLIPPLAFLYCAKPNIGFALALSWNQRVAKFALTGAIVLFVLSILLAPAWPFNWISNLPKAVEMGSPLTSLGGVFVLLAILRWRRPEARMLVALACVRQTTSWYELLPLFLVPGNFREMVYFGLVVSTGSIFERFAMVSTTEIDFNRQVGALMVAVGYLPATILVLRRPNEGDLPPWMQRVGRSVSERLMLSRTSPVAKHLRALPWNR